MVYHITAIQLIVECSDDWAHIYLFIYLLYKSWAKSQNRNTNHACI